MWYYEVIFVYQLFDELIILNIILTIKQGFHLFKGHTDHAILLTSQIHVTSNMKTHENMENVSRT